MTMVSVGVTNWPVPTLAPTLISAALSRTNITFDSDTDRVAWVGRSHLTDTLTTIYFRTGNVTTGCILNVRVETVTNGRPSGTLFAANTSASVTVANGDDNVWKTATLTAAASLTVGDEFAILFTVDTAGDTPNMQFSVVSAADHVPLAGLYPMLLHDLTGTWTNIDVSLHMIVEMGTAGVTFFPNMSPQEGAGTIHAPTNASTPDEYAAKFVAPFKGRLVGVQVGMFNIAAGADFTVSLWPSSSTTDGDALAQSTMDGDFPIAATEDGYVYITFSEIPILTAGTTYYLGVRADTANAIGVGSFTASSVVTNAIRGFPIGANTFHQATRAWTAGSADAWVLNTTVFPLVSLVFDQLDDGTGGGGGGGMRLAGHGGLAA